MRGRVFTFCSLAALSFGILFSGCTTTVPSCSDNPRQMSCFTPGQLQKELSK